MLPSRRRLQLRLASARYAYRTFVGTPSMYFPMCSRVRTESRYRTLSPASSSPGYFKSNEKLPQFWRTYSMSGPLGVGTYRIRVKRAAGAGSQYLHDHVRAGDLLQVSAPRGNFTLARGTRPVVLLSAGIGATPALAMLYALAAVVGQSERDVWWCYGARNGREPVFQLAFPLAL